MLKIERHLELTSRKHYMIRMSKSTGSMSCNIHECVNIAISHSWVIYRDRIGRGTRQVGNTTS